MTLHLKCPMTSDSLYQFPHVTPESSSMYVLVNTPSIEWPTMPEVTMMQSQPYEAVLRVHIRDPGSTTNAEVDMFNFACAETSQIIALD